MILDFIIPGKVKAKQSVKFTHSGIKYTPRDVKRYANDVRIAFFCNYPKWDIANFKDKPLKVTIEVQLAIPHSFSKKKREQALKDEIRPAIRPDCDNICKNICDALNGMAYKDDKQIVSLVVNKYYADSDSVRVQIEDL